MPHPVATALLSLPAALYGVVVRARNRRYDRPGASVRASVPVISVGNLTVGGTGKTPIVAWLASRLAVQDRLPAIVSRGYRGTAGKGPLLVSAGDGPLVDWRASGDEPHLLARTLRGVRVVVGSDRVAGAREAVTHGARIVVLDDGFQHRRLGRDVDIVLIDADDPFGGERLLPAGRLREPVDGLSRADVVLITRVKAGQDCAAIERAVRRHNRDAPVLLAGHRAVGFVDPSGAEAPAPARALAFCGIGNPGAFRRDVEAQGVEIVSFRPFRDHHAFGADEVRALVAAAAAANATLVTTEKDVTRLGTVLPPGASALSLRIEAEIFEPEPLLALVEAAYREAA